MDSYPSTHDDNSFDIPPLMNPPPQVFGAYAPGSPLGANFSESFFPDDQNGGSLEETNDAKRRRIARV